MKRRTRPTPKQLHTLNVIAALSSESAAGFTYMDIARRSGVTKVTAYEHVKALVAKGLVAHGERWKARGISLTAAGKRLVKGDPIKCPNCGVPLTVAAESLRHRTQEIYEEQRSGKAC